MEEEGSVIESSASMPRDLAHRPHGSGVRGADSAPRSTLFEGRFGRMFRALPPAQFSVDALRTLAQHMTAEFEPNATPETANPPDDEENSGISAGYTYLGQFIDHDLTFDPASSLQKQDDPDALTDFRTPRFDLDSIYGRGPDDQPYLYRDDGLHMLLGRQLTGSAFDANTLDVPRNTPSGGEPQRALIGDPRNDENTLVAQLHATFLRFHNRVADFLAKKQGVTPAFSDVQKYVRWHYQWVLLHDFLPTIIGRETMLKIVPQLRHEDDITAFDPDLRFFRPRKSPFMPVEFSVAAYRFGHSMVRPEYRVNTTLPAAPGTDGRIPIFPPAGGDIDEGLTGFRAFPPDRAVDWSLFFAIRPDKPFTSGRIQPAYKIDSSLVNALGRLPASVAKDPSSLPERNLLRGLRMGLPSGQSVAHAMGIEPVPDEKLRVGKATEANTPTNPKLADLDPQFRGRAPLWFYILAEAQQQFRANATPIHLGPVGGRIVGEVFVGLLMADSHSYMRQRPRFRPFAEFQRDGRFGIAELIVQASRSR